MTNRPIRANQRRSDRHYATPSTKMAMWMGITTHTFDLVPGAKVVLLLQPQVIDKQIPDGFYKIFSVFRFTRLEFKCMPPICQSLSPDGAKTPIKLEDIIVPSGQLAASYSFAYNNQIVDAPPYMLKDITHYPHSAQVRSYNRESANVIVPRDYLLPPSTLKHWSLVPANPTDYGQISWQTVQGHIHLLSPSRVTVRLEMIYTIEFATCEAFLPVDHPFPIDVPMGEAYLPGEKLVYGCCGHPGCSETHLLTM